MFLSELKRLYQNTIIRWSIICLLIAYGLFMSLTFYGPENQSYRDEFKQVDSLTTYENSYLENQVNAYDNYQNDLRERIKNNETKLSMSIFDDAFVRALIESENQTLRKVQKIDFELMPSYATTITLESPFFAILAMLLSSILIYALFLEDIVQQSIRMYKSTKHSLSKLFYVKISTFGFILFMFTFICLSITIMFAHFDGIDLNAPIQSLFDYRFNINFITIFQQILLKFLVQSIITFIVGFFVLMLVLIFKNIALGYGAILLILLSEYFLFSFTSVTSSFTFMKYINLYFYLFKGVTNLRWVRFANIMLDFGLVFTITTFITGIVTMFASRYMYTRLSTGFKQFKSRGYQIKSIHLAWHEVLRTLYFSKGFILVLFILLFSLYRYVDFSITKSQSQLNYERIESQYYGELNQKAFERIDIEIEKAHEAYEIIMSNEAKELSQAEYRALETQAAPYPSLLRIREKMIERKGSGSTYFVEDSGYKYLFGREGQYSSIIHFIIITMALTLYVALNVIGEYQKKLSHLYVSTQRGHIKKQSIDMILFMGIAIILIVLVYGLFILKLQKGYAIYQSNQSLVNLISTTKSSMSLWTYTGISFIAHVLVYSTVIRLTYILSRRYDLVLITAIAFVFCLIQTLLFTIAPAFSILHLLNISMVNQPFVSVLWVVVLIILNFWLQIKELNRFKA